MARRVFPVPAPLDLQAKVGRTYCGYETRSVEKKAAEIAYCNASEASRYVPTAAEEILDGTGELA